MKIEIGETDSLFNDGVAKNIMLSLEGRVFPYPLERTVAQLIEDIKKIEVVIPSAKINFPDRKPAEAGSAKQALTQAPVSLEIEREDLIKVINVLPRFKDVSGNEMIDPGISAGGIYRVLKINQVMVVLPDKPDELTKIVQSYEIVDDKSPVPVRLTAFPQEVELYQKRKVKMDKFLVMSEIYSCGYCGQENVLTLDHKKNKYTGACDKCGKNLEIDKPVKKEEVKT